MVFEYNENKSKANERKHGLNFKEAQVLWEDPECVIIPAKTVGESRFLLIGRLEKKIWSAIFTVRDQNIRIISVRRARKNEEGIYKNS